MDKVTFTLQGNQIGSYVSLSGDGNVDDRVLQLFGVQALGGAGDVFTVVVEQVTPGDTQFRNGQFVTIYDASGAVVMATAGVQPDKEQGRAAGDAHLVITDRNIVIDFAGLSAAPETRSYTVDDDPADPGVGDNDGELDWVDVAGFVCIAEGTLVSGAFGPRRVERLRPGEYLRCASGRLARVDWIGLGRVDFAAGAAQARRPVRFPQGCLGNGLPQRDLLLSPQHRVLLQGPVVRRLTGREAVLAPARGLLPLARVRVAEGMRRIGYVSVLLDRHDVIEAEGAPVESFLPGPQGLADLAPEQRQALARVMPQLARGEAEAIAAYGSSCLPLLTVRQAEEVAREMRRDSELREGMRGKGMSLPEEEQESGEAPFRAGVRGNMAPDVTPGSETDPAVSSGGAGARSSARA